MGKVSDAAIEDEANLYPYMQAAQELLRVYPQLYKQKLLDAKLRTAYTVDEKQLYIDLLVSIIKPFADHLNLKLNFGIDSVIEYHMQEQDDRSPI